MTNSTNKPPARFNMAAYTIGRAATARPQHPALLVFAAPAQPPTEVWTFADLENAVLRISGGLAARAWCRASASSCSSTTRAPCPLLFFGAIAGGFVPIPTSPQLTEPEVRFLLRGQRRYGPRHGSDARDLSP